MSGSRHWLAGLTVGFAGVGVALVVTAAAVVVQTITQLSEIAVTRIVAEGTTEPSVPALSLDTAPVLY